MLCNNQIRKNIHTSIMFADFPIEIPGLITIDPYAITQNPADHIQIAASVLPTVRLHTDHLYHLRAFLSAPEQGQSL